MSQIELTARTNAPVLYFFLYLQPTILWTVSINKRINSNKSTYCTFTSIFVICSAEQTPSKYHFYPFLSITIFISLMLYSLFLYFFTLFSYFFLCSSFFNLSFFFYFHQICYEEKTGGRILCCAV